MSAHGRNSGLAAYNSVSVHGGVASADPHRLVQMLLDAATERMVTARGCIERGETVRKAFFARDPRMLEIVSHLSDDQVGALRRGGHSNRKVYAGYKRALESKGRPSVILAHTVKGWRLGEAFEPAPAR